ncbi:MAG TPA: hypothetical protein VLU92_04075, partial [Candidatus Dormibacteraeota bacterium]|nr:hypothetical protein [Candidatus Dormibacteraeota bacterium]
MANVFFLMAGLPVHAAVQPLTIVNSLANTTTTLASSLDPSAAGQAVTFTATVSVDAPGSTAVGPPSGSVSFAEGTTVLGTGTLSTSGGVTTASFTTN